MYETFHKNKLDEAAQTKITCVRCLRTIEGNLGNIVGN